MKFDTRFLSALSVAAVLASPALAKDSTKQAAAARPATTATTARHEPLDINSATEAQLAAMPAIGEAYAKKIVAGRPYKEKSDLLHKKIAASADRDQVGVAPDTRPP